MIEFILIYLIIGMWLAADVLRYSPQNLAVPDWFIAAVTTFLWPLYVIFAIVFLIKRIT